MKIKDLKKYSTAEKIFLAEQLWDSIAKKEIELSDEIKNELDNRLHIIEEGKTEYYSWNEVKNHLKEVRK
ncbi:addiction module protein [Flavobacterium sp.]|uniref:addiction module protein n=1 Tax=Flavobacterium sp. TaxID=239 RepID=UPI00261CAC31|nr:addiction module protein [Flavobacterium sp.]